MPFWQQTLVGLLALICGAVSGIAEPLVIQNDRGGYLAKQLDRLAELKKSDRRVEVRGDVCFSTCTLYLSLPNMCADAETIFGFHGPMRIGRKMSTEEFDYFSQLIASHYPERIGQWYLETGREKRFGAHKIKARDMAQYGVKICDS